MRLHFTDENGRKVTDSSMDDDLRCNIRVTHCAAVGLAIVSSLDKKAPSLTLVVCKAHLFARYKQWHMVPGCGAKDYVAYCVLQI